MKPFLFLKELTEISQHGRATLVSPAGFRLTSFKHTSPPLHQHTVKFRTVTVCAKASASHFACVTSLFLPKAVRGRRLQMGALENFRVLQSGRASRWPVEGSGRHGSSSCAWERSCPSCLLPNPASCGVPQSRTR